MTPVVAMADQEVTLAVQLGPGGKFYVRVPSTPPCLLRSQHSASLGGRSPKLSEECVFRVLIRVHL